MTPGKRLDVESSPVQEPRVLSTLPDVAVAKPRSAVPGCRDARGADTWLPDLLGSRPSPTAGSGPYRAAGFAQFTFALLVHSSGWAIAGTRGRGGSCACS